MPDITFTDEERAFIPSLLEFLEAVEDLRVATDRAERLRDAVRQRAGELGHTDAEGWARQFELMRAAVRSGGHGPDSRIAQNVEQSYEAVLRVVGVQKAADEAYLARINADAPRL